MKDDNTFMKIIKKNDNSCKTMKYNEKVAKNHEHKEKTLQSIENIGQLKENLKCHENDPGYDEIC